jgi:hypothetical protein
MGQSETPGSRSHRVVLGLKGSKFKVLGSKFRVGVEGRRMIDL